MLKLWLQNNNVQIVVLMDIPMWAQAFRKEGSA